MLACIWRGRGYTSIFPADAFKIIMRNIRRNELIHSGIVKQFIYPSSYSMFLRWHEKTFFPLLDKTVFCSHSSSMLWNTDAQWNITSEYVCFVEGRGEKTKLKIERNHLNVRQSLILWWDVVVHLHKTSTYIISSHTHTHIWQPHVDILKCYERRNGSEQRKRNSRQTENTNITNKWSLQVQVTTEIFCQRRRSTLNSHLATPWWWVWSTSECFVLSIQRNMVTVGSFYFCANLFDLHKQTRDKRRVREILHNCRCVVRIEQK